MNEREFNDLIDQTYQKIEQFLDEAAADALDYSMTSPYVLEIDCPNDKSIIVSRHEALKELWIAAPSGAYHFRWTGFVWQDTRSDKEFFALLSELTCA